MCSLAALPCRHSALPACIPTTSLADDKDDRAGLYFIMKDCYDFFRLILI